MNKIAKDTEQPDDLNVILKLFNGKK